MPAPPLEKEVTRHKIQFVESDAGTGGLGQPKTDHEARTSGRFIPEIATLVLDDLAGERQTEA